MNLEGNSLPGDVTVNVYYEHAIHTFLLLTSNKNKIANVIILLVIFAMRG